MTGALLVALAAAAAPAAPAPQPLTLDHLLGLARISEPALSPDGRSVAFTLRTTDRAANRARFDLWLVGGDGSGLRRLTDHPENDTGPTWSPDGAALYFLSPRSGSSQVWRVPVGGGEPEQVSRLPLDVAGFRLAPDGTRLVLAVDVFPDCPDLACTVARLAEREARQAPGRLYDRLFVRHWNAWEDGLRSHLLVVPVAGGEPVDVTRGLDADVPAPPFGGMEEVAFSPDGRQLAFSAKVAGRAEAWSTDFDIYLVPADGSAPPRELTLDNPAWDARPLFSPDGRTLAHLAMERPGYEGDHIRVVLRPLSGGPPRVLAADWDRSPAEIAFSPDGGTLYATAPDGGEQRLFALDARSGAVRALSSAGTVRGPTASRERVVFTLESLEGPAELWSVRPDGSDPRPLTAINRDRLEGVALGSAEQFHFPGWNDERVHAWIVQPANRDPGRRYPLVLLLHGGPQSSFGNEFRYLWSSQVYAGAGYAALAVDFHGSTGYGQAFTDSIRGDWGGKPLVDIERGIAAALDRYPWLDGERVCVLGASFGGYLVNWIAGRWPGRFRCLVSHAGPFDLRELSLTTDELWLPEWELGGSYWQAPEEHERHNPVNHVARWKTPMLILHGELDYGVPQAQGIAAFTALQRRGIPSQLLATPNEGHWTLRPASSVLWHETVLAWLDRWLRLPP
ncbi:MAG TPA: S9 family peptidase [Thermoanaerobaculia bacterium]|nr:S9 family peptidase [Thermoanaerobaculia bacterium]